MRVNLLGPLEVEGNAGAVTISAAKERYLLAALALAARSVVSIDSLIVALWGEDPPPAARKTLQTYVWHLRQALGDHVIVTQPPGYVLCVDETAVDVLRFRALVREGEADLRSGSPSQARIALTDAVRLWRGEPLAGVAAHTGLATEAVRLREEYLSALEARVAADLADGAHDEVAPELEALVRQHPFRERLWGHLMVAHYRCGRQSDALAAYQRARELLASELGLEPGGELRRLERAILNHDPSIAWCAADAHRAPSPLAPNVDGAIIRSPVRFTASADGVNIAYQTAGDGTPDILAVPGFVSHLDTWWNAPSDGLVRRLIAMGRLISFDKRGMGLSDRPERVDSRRWVDDAVAVLDAVGSECAVVLGVSAGVPTAIQLAATHPERVRALVLHGGFARQAMAEDYPIGHDRATLESFAANLERGWGTGVAISSYAPSRANEPGVRAYWARYQLLSASPSAAIRYFWASIDNDVRELLPSIAVPTLVLHPERDKVVPVAQGEYVAGRIPGARLVTLDSDVHLICLSDVLEETADEIEAFLGALRDDQPVEDEVLVTVLAVHASTPAGRRAVSSLLESCGGHVQGPTVTATFSGPGRAMRAAAQLARGTFGMGTLGLGIHCGECVAAQDGYRGPAVDIAHELAERAADREVLVTAVAANFTRDHPFADATPEDVITKLGRVTVLAASLDDASRRLSRRGR